MNTLFANAEALAQIKKWMEAKQNMDGWNAVKKEAEAALIKHYQADFDRLASELEGSRTLTTTVGIGDDMKVTIGDELKIGQLEAAEFLLEYPTMLGVLLKAEYKPASSAVVLGKLMVGDEVGAALGKVATFKPKTPGFAAR